MLFSLFAMLSHATSYRKIHSFISIHFETLKDVFDLSWKRAPAYTTIRNITKGLSPEEAEKAVRMATWQMIAAPAGGVRFLYCDGKA